MLGRLGRASRPLRIGGRLYLAAAAILTLLVFDWDWAFVLAIEFTVGTTVVVAIASAPADLVMPGGVASLSGARLSAGRIVLAKWSGAFRYALGFIMIPLSILFLRTVPDLRLWTGFPLLIGYMLAVSAAAASLGVAVFMTTLRRIHAVLVATVAWMLAIIPWYALETPDADASIRKTLSMYSPIRAMESLSGAVMIGSSSAAAWPVLSIVVYAACAVVLLLAARANSRGLSWAQITSS